MIRERNSTGDPDSKPAEIEFEEMSDKISDVRYYDIPALVIFVALLIIVGLQFFTRYVLNDSLGWTEEIARYLLILLGFIGSILCVRKGSHINLEFAYRYFPPRAVKPLAVFVDAVVTVFFAYAGVLAIELAERTSTQMMVSIEIPKGVIYYTVVGACFTMALFAALRLYRTIVCPSHVVVAEKLEHGTSGG